MAQPVYALNRLHDLLNRFRALDFLAPLAIRLYLAPVMLVAGWHKVENFDSVVQWFGNTEWGLGLPMPAVMLSLAIIAELAGGVLILVGLATRYAALPLIFTMLVAAVTAHWDNGWFAIAPSDPATSAARPLAALGIDGAEQSLANSEQVAARLEQARSLLRENGDYSWLTAKGSYVILNNGIEFATTYLIMLLVLFFGGAGRFFSVDYWIASRFRDYQEDIV
ncbi:MAG: DoxX family membrane protein [Alcanivoracaceae bacterium]|jgi:uncharacterized membrane protein YphA (DoxX/SURF4 family)|nr:DoxX family membrane protein [Alcanivoracaceae bacterium]